MEVDDHHTVEDTALCLGDALGDRTGIHRFGEAIAQAALDIGGRPYCVTALDLTTPHIGALTTQNIPHALEAFARTAGITLHLTAAGRNDHHVAEAAFAVRFEEPPASRRRNPPPADHPTHPPNQTNQEA